MSRIIQQWNFSLIVLSCLSLWYWAPVKAATIFVPADYPTLQEGIDAAADNDLILIAGGLYLEEGFYDVAVDGKALTIASEDPAYPCTLVGHSAVRGLLISDINAGEVVLRGLILKQFSLDNASGAGLLISNATVRVVDCVITHNSVRGANVHGAGLACSDANVELVNSLVVNNSLTMGSGSGIGIYGLRSAILLTNCTVAGNGNELLSVVGGGLAVEGLAGQGVIQASILFFNQAESGGQLAVLDNAGAFVLCSTVQDGALGVHTSPTAQLIWLAGNLTADPLFVAGAAGDYYLSDPASGQPTRSPCVNAGHAPASAVCYDFMGEPVCLNSFTTRIDQLVDEGTVDIGYHYYPLAIATFTPTPSPSVTPSSPPTPFETFTPEPSATQPPTPTPVITATEPPASPTPPSTPPPTTPVPTETPEPTQAITPTPPEWPTATPTVAPPTPTPVVELYISQETFYPGDWFWLTAVILNPGPQEYHDQPFAVVLDIYGTFFFYPSWGQNSDYERATFRIGLTVKQILNFIWPSGGGSYDGIYFYAGLVNEDWAYVIGKLGIVRFGYQDFR